MSRTQQLCDSMLDTASFSIVYSGRRFSAFQTATKRAFKKKENLHWQLVFPNRDRAPCDVNPCLKKIEIKDQGSDCSTSIRPGNARTVPRLGE